MVQAKAIYSELALTRESATVTCSLADKGRQRCGRTLQWNKGKAQVCTDRLLAWGSQRPADSMQGIVRLVRGCMFVFLCLVLNWKQGQKLGKLSVLDQVLTILGQLLQKLLFSFLDCNPASGKAKVQLVGFLGCRLQVGVGFLDWLLQVLSQSSIFVDGLTFVNLYLHSLTAIVRVSDSVIS